jgi:hypothetical protein
MTNLPPNAPPNPASFAPLNAEGVMVIPEVRGGALHLRVAGAVEMRDPGDVLNPYWNMIDEEARRRRMKRVEVDLRDLNFMNSSGILTLVRWITRVKAHGAQDGYQLVLRYDRNVTWQRTSIPTLAKLAPNIVTAAEIDG